MNVSFLLGVTWPQAASFEYPDGVAAAVAFLLVMWFMAALKRTTDEHYRLLEERRELQRETELAQKTADSEEGGTSTATSSGKPNTVGAVVLLLVASGFTFADEDKGPPPTINVTAYVETYIAWNFNRPANGVTAFRGFDARHNTFALSNAVIDTRWTAGAVSGRVALQTGDTPDIYYGSEAASGVRHILEATMAWKAPVGRGLTLDGGLFLSPIGPEVIPVKDNWTWSRSTLFFGLPFYHAGFRATYPMSERWSVTSAVFNGWNSVTDTNGRKSISVQGLYTKPDKMGASVLYFGGAERPTGAPEGEPWRHLFDAHITATVSPVWSFQAHVNAGFENTAFGRASWRAGAFTARVKANKWFHVAGRADLLDETIPSSRSGSASPLFFPTTRVQSLTSTLEGRPSDHMSARLEFRHDSAKDPIYFEGSSRGASARSQSTLTFGLTAWF